MLVRRSSLLAVLVVAAIVLGGCGQKGDLVLPDSRTFHLW